MGANLPKLKEAHQCLFCFARKIVHTIAVIKRIMPINTMTINTAERHQIENEMIFRRMNEKVGDDLGELDAMHIADNDISLIRDVNLNIHFKCECSDEDCDIRVPLKLEEYQTIHTNRDTFVIMPGHQVDPIETVLIKNEKYSVVKKNNSTPEPGKELNITIIDNG